jgi:DNA-directed RNA polymerase subunit RPC12/RpoP
MSPGQCSCPDCGTILRIRDRSFIGREIECPDCQSKLVIRLDGERELIAERPKVEKAQKKPPVNQPIGKKSGTTFGSKLAGVMQSPLALAWALGIGMTAFIAIMMLRPNVRFRKPTKDLIVQAPAPVEVQKPDEPKAETPIESPDQGTTVLEGPATPTELPADTETPSTQPPTAVDPLVEKPITPIVTPEVTPEIKPNPAPVVVKLDLEAMLGQRLKSFETPAQPKSRREIIELLEELLGAPIRYAPDELGEKNLDRSISIDLENTTVGGVLKVLLDSAGWEYIVEDNGLRIRPRQVAGMSM